jgi:hypothetical protein
MTNSKLIDGKRLSPNHSGKRKQKVTKIAIHHAAGIISGYNLAGVFANPKRKASANYCLGSDAKLYLTVDEANRAWTTSSAWCDNRAVTIEVGNSTGSPTYKISDDVLAKLIDLVYDICKRNNIYPCTYTGDKTGVLQMHRWYKGTACPGPYLSTKFQYIADEVNKRLDKDKKKDLEPYIIKVDDKYKVTVGALNIRSAPSPYSKKVGVITDGGIYTIVEQNGNWGRLKSGAGWISLDYTKKL